MQQLVAGQTQAGHWCGTSVRVQPAAHSTGLVHAKPAQSPGPVSPLNWHCSSGAQSAFELQLELLGS